VQADQTAGPDGEPALASAAGRRQRTDEIEAAIGNWTETLNLT
jgi:hypothetical protein